MLRRYSRPALAPKGGLLVDVAQLAPVPTETSEANARLLTLEPPADYVPEGRSRGEPRQLGERGWVEWPLALARRPHGH
jgi:hypothetical protein